MPDAAVRTRTDTEHGRYDRLVAEVLRLRCELDRRAEAPAIDLLARATTAEAQLAEARDDLAISEVANEALRAALKAAEAELASRDEQARAQKQDLRNRADALQDERDELRGRLATAGHEFAEYREAAEHAHRDRLSCRFALGRLVGVAIGTAVVSGLAGAEAVGHALRGWSW